jgi:hypothetical protein
MYTEGILRELTEPGLECGRQLPLYDFMIDFILRDIVAGKTVENSENLAKFSHKTYCWRF